MSPTDHDPINVLVVSGAPAALGPLADALVSGGFSVETVGRGGEALSPDRLRRQSAVVIDDTLTDTSVLALTAEIRRRDAVPIVVLAGFTAEDAVVAILEAGADQFIPKPARLHEVVARVRVAVRRTPAAKQDVSAVEVGDVRLDPHGYVVSVSGREVRLTLKEFDLLHLLMANAGQTLTRRILIDRVWGRESTEGKTLDTHIRRIRAKIEDDPAQPNRIKTVRKVGYRYQTSDPKETAS